jgi:hypothetical protein
MKLKNLLIIALFTVAAEGATIAKVARRQIEKSTGKSALSKLNAKSGMMIGKNETKEVEN